MGKNIKRINLGMPEALYLRVKAQADARGMTLTAYVRGHLEDYIREEAFRDTLSGDIRQRLEEHDERMLLLARLHKWEKRRTCE